MLPKLDFQFEVEMNKELYPSLLERTKEQMRDNYLEKTKEMIENGKKRLLELKEKFIE